MLDFSSLARKNLSEKFQGFRMIGSLALNASKKFFEIEEKPESILEDKPLLTGYLKFHTLFFKTSDQNLKIQIFKEKNKLLSYINAYLASLGYQHKITDIRLK